MGRFCGVCGTLQRFVNESWICPKCTLQKKEANSVNYSNKAAIYSRENPENDGKKLKTFQYNNNDYIFFEKWSDVIKAGSSLEDYIGVICTKNVTKKNKHGQKYNLCVELKYFVENNQEMVPIEQKYLEGIISCNNTACQNYCLFYPRDPEEFSTKFLNYNKKRSKEEQKRRYKRSETISKDLEARI